MGEYLVTQLTAAMLPKALVSKDVSFSEPRANATVREVTTDDGQTVVEFLPQPGRKG